ncbi:SH3 domain-containing protein [Aquimarina sp. I32.4]|uniref:SH3 domain-containing protein n=1 Tax=Aquimarina sp. I32.4 TaxID=2053903 RepID=UPI000CDE9957|nr:SH3 domain-containing protein [Aquimarina sp. I32.4]
MVRYFIFIILCISIKSISQPSQFQNHLYTSSVIYNTKVNIRTNPSIQSKVIATVNPGEELVMTHSQKRDTINKIPGHWVKINYQNQIAYVWDHLIARSAFRFHTDTDYKILVKQESAHKIGVKVLYQDQQIHHQLIEIKSTQSLHSVFSIGTTYNSNNKEVIIFIFADNTSLLYQWHNKKLIPFTKDLPLPFLSNKLWGFITANNVNIRSAPSITSQVIKNSNIQDKFEVLDIQHQPDTINGKKGYWIQIKHNTQEAYVWSNFITTYGIESTKTKGLLFLAYNNHIWVVKNGEIVDKIKASIDNLVPLGNLGVPEVQELIGGCHYAESCGETGGDTIYSWDGNQIKHFIDNTGIGDGGLSEGHTVIFPSFTNGIKNNIIDIQSESESIDIPSSDLSSTVFQNVDRKNIKKTYTFSNGKLIEKTTTTQKIKSFVNKEFKGYQLGYYKVHDFNSDGYPDAFVYAFNLDYSSKKRSIFAILQGDTSNSYTLHSFNKSLIIHNENDPLTDVTLNKKGFELAIYYSGYYTNPYESCIIKLEYAYIKSHNDFQLTKETKLVQDTDDRSWDRTTVLFRKNQILFKNSWHSALEPSN